MVPLWEAYYKAAQSMHASPCCRDTKMAAWHTDSFSVLPVGGGYEGKVNEFDWEDGNFGLVWTW